MLTTMWCGFTSNCDTDTFGFGTDYKTMPAVCWQRERYLQTTFGFGRATTRPFTDANFRTVRGGPGNFTCMWTLQEGSALGDDVALLVDTDVKLRIRNAEIYPATGSFTWTPYGGAGSVYT